MGIVQAQHDTSSYYILGYYSSNTATDGRNRRIKVPVHRNQSARLEYRSGYFASKEFKQFTSSDRERQLQEALMRGDPVTDLSIAWRSITSACTRPLLRSRVGQDTGQRRRTRPKGRGGKHKTRFHWRSERRWRRTARHSARRHRTFETKIVIPDLTTEQKYLPISSVVLSYQRENIAAPVGSAERDKKLLAANPLIQDNEKLVPSVTRVFRKDHDMYVYLEIYQPEAEKTELLVASVSFYRRVKAFETAPLKITAGLNAKSKAVPVGFSVPLKKL